MNATQRLNAKAQETGKPWYLVERNRCVKKVCKLKEGDRVLITANPNPAQRSNALPPIQPQRGETKREAIARLFPVGTRFMLRWDGYGQVLKQMNLDWAEVVGHTNHGNIKAVVWVDTIITVKPDQIWPNSITLP